jgi:hypothetical protein
MMGKLYCFIALLFLSFNASAQSTDTVRRDTSKRFMIVDTKSIDKNEKPLCVVDGIIFKGNIKQINPNDILQVAILKPPGSVNIYGPQGANGAILISTKRHQNINAGKNADTVKSALSNSAVYIIDGVISNKKLEGIDPKDILSIDVLKKNKTTESTEIDPAHDMVIVVTKAGAVKSYQKKLSDFSVSYKKYLDSHNGDDSGLTYVVDGDIYNKWVDDLEKLYKLPKEKIAKVAISVKDKIMNVNITTKK